MNKKMILITGLMAATMLTISACSSKDTATETTTAPVTTTAEATTTAETTTVEETTIAATTIAETKKLAPGEMSAEDIRSFAEEIQITVADKDLDALADLCGYPVFVGLEDGEGLEVQDKDEFLAIGADKVFTKTLLEEIAAVDLEKLEQFEAGVVMGDEANVIFGSVEDAPAITGINL